MEGVVAAGQASKQNPLTFFRKIGLDWIVIGSQKYKDQQKHNEHTDNEIITYEKYENM